MPVPILNWALNDTIGYISEITKVDKKVAVVPWIYANTLHKLFKEADAVEGKFAYLNMYAVSITWE